ncbi:MAG: discoidin domain-containing protein [Acidobacteria bacterium]|nr:discoidin domain-containing protein [Acidobacteriota bacterium]MBV9478253.1 discoidin domain-containing protein [Acidobacteriota bacterium]
MRRAALVLVLLLAAPLHAAVLDDFHDVRGWIAAASDGVELHIVEDHGAMRLDFDFHGGAGYAIARKPLKLTLPSDYQFTYRLRGETPPNTLEFKLLDPSGESVWWVNRRNLTFPREWQTQRVLKRHLEFAWGPSNGAPLTQTSALELVITASSGGKGSVWIDDLTFSPRAARPEAPPPPRGAWRAKTNRDATYTADFGRPFEFGGLTLDWQSHATDYDVETSDDGKQWDTIAKVRGSNGGRDPLFLPDSDARYLRIHMLRGPKPFALRGLTFQPLSFSSSRNAFFTHLAGDTRRGLYPRYFHNEESYWSVVGAVNDEREALLNEDGAIELDRASASVEPFLFVDGQLVTWDDAEKTQSLANDILPIPSVTWRARDLTLTITAYAQAKQIFARYRITNAASTTRKATLFLAVRPFQVNSAFQFLNVPGGVATVNELACANGVVRAQDVRVATATPANGFGAAAFASGDITEWLARNELPAAQRVHDDFGAASGALRYDLALPANGTRDVYIASGETDDRPTPALAEALLADATHEWTERLGRFTLELDGDEGAAVARAVKSNVAWILINQDGPAIQPGSRSYDRSWIRDGSLTSDALLRLGYSDFVRPFVAWYTPFQFPNGKVPCCVDARGADPVPENDSHGELLFLLAEYLRYTHDRALVEQLWPHVENDVAYIESLTAQRKTAEYQTPEKRAYYGLVPESISHEGYSAKPMHSYWDDFFIARGLDDAAFLASALGKSTDYARRAEEFHRDLHASIEAARAMHHIDYIPGCVELGDFDATSTTIALYPANERTHLNADALNATFERYYRESMQRIATNQWEGYTPYEWRTVGSFVRLGWRERAHEMIAFFMQHTRPAAWNQWSEVVYRDARHPSFIGDMPHTWVGSDFIRSILDLFVYEDDGALVINAGVPLAWTRGRGAIVRGIQTPYGTVNVTIRDGVAAVTGDAKPPRGFVLRSSATTPSAP